MIERVKQFLAPPEFAERDKTRVAYILNFITLTFIAIIIAAIVISVFVIGDVAILSNPTSGIRAYIVIGFLLAVQYLMRTGRVQVASSLLVLFLLTFLTILSYISGGSLANAYTNSIIVVVMAGLLLNNRAMIGIIAYFIILGAVYFILAGQNLLPAFSPISPEERWIGVVITLLMVGASLYLFTRQIKETEDETQIANEELEKARYALEVLVSRKTRGLELAAEVGSDLAQERDLDILLEKAVASVQEQFDLYYVQIYLADFAERRLLLRAGTGAVGDTLVQSGHRLAVGPGSINGAAAYSRQPIVVSDTATNPLFRPNVLLPNTKAEMAVPLIVADRVVGVLNVQSDQAYGLTTEDFTTYNVLAGQIAIAIENANLFSETSKTQQDIELAAHQSTRDAWESYLDAIERHERFGYTFDGISLDEVQIESQEELNLVDEGLVVPIVINGEHIGSIEVAADDLQDSSLVMVNAVAQQVAQQAESLRLLSEAEKYRDEAEDAVRRLTRENWEVYESHLASFGYEYDHDLVHPLEQVDATEDAASLIRDIAIHGEAIGQLEICDVDADAIEVEALVSSVASALSSHLENLRLTEQTETALADSQKRGEELDLINRIVSLATESLDMEYTLQAIADVLGHEMNYDRASIALVDHAKNNFTIAAEFNSSENANNTKGMTFSLDGMGIMTDVVENGNTVIVDDLQAKETKSPALVIMKERGVHLFAVLPMQVGQDVVGMLSIASMEAGRKISEGELALLRTMIQQIGTAVQNAQLFTDTQQRARRDQILNEITARVYTAVDAESILRTAAKEINRQFGLETYVYLDDEAELTSQTENGRNGDD